MERFTNSSEYDRQQAREHARVIAFGIGMGVFALAGVIVILAYGRYSWLVFGGSVLCALVAWGFTYAIVYVIALPNEPGDWNDTEERDVPEPPTPPTDQIKHQFTAVWDGYLRLGNSLIAIPAEVGEDNIIHIATMRARGALETVSLRALDGIGISRFATNPPNAQSVMKFLGRAGAIDENGEWTRQGLIDFPYPPANGRRGSFAGGVSTDTTTTGGGGVSHRGVA